MKSKVSRFTGVPLTKSGRQRKYGALMGGCLMDVLFWIAIVVTLIVIL